MWTNYTKIIFRNLTKHQLHSFINILSLALGIGRIGYHFSLRPG